MNKSIINLSIVATALLFVGCGGGGSTKDETPPVFSSSVKYNYILNEGTEVTVPVDVTDDVTAKEKLKIISHDNQNITSSFIYKAPSVSGNKSFQVTVTATDEAGNSASKVYTFSITDIYATTAHSYVAVEGDKKFKDISSAQDRSELKVLESKLTWIDKAEDQSKNYNQAVSYCSAQGARLATRNEIFNTLNYKYNKDANSSMIDRDFTHSLDILGVWAKIEDGKKFYVNHANGVDVVETNTSALHYARCVKGVADRSTFTKVGNVVKDNKSGLEWSAVSADVKTLSEANSACNGGGLFLPTINELRTIYDFGKNEFYSNITDDKNATLWSGTSLTFESDKHYYIESENVWDPASSESAAIQSDVSNTTTYKHQYICVKRPQ